MPVAKDKKSSRACYFCASNIREMDHKETELLRKFISFYGKIVPRKRSGVCAKHQKKLVIVIKRARAMELLPFLVQ